MLGSALNFPTPVQDSSMPRAESRIRSSAVVGGLARLAYLFVRQQVDRFSALTWVLRGTQQARAPRRPAAGWLVRSDD